MNEVKIAKDLNNMSYFCSFDGNKMFISKENKHVGTLIKYNNNDVVFEPHMMNGLPYDGSLCEIIERLGIQDSDSYFRYFSSCIQDAITNILDNCDTFYDLPSSEDCMFDSDEVQTEIMSQERCLEYSDGFMYYLDDLPIYVYYSMNKNDEGSSYTVDYGFEMDELGGDYE